MEYLPGIDAIGPADREIRRDLRWRADAASGGEAPDLRRQLIAKAAWASIRSTCRR
jgi:hypothetical protein